MLKRLNFQERLELAAEMAVETAAIARVAAFEATTGSAVDLSELRAAVDQQVRVTTATLNAFQATAGSAVATNRVNRTLLRGVSDVTVVSEPTPSPMRRRWASLTPCY